MFVYDVFSMGLRAVLYDCKEIKLTLKFTEPVFYRIEDNPNF